MKVLRHIALFLLVSFSAMVLHDLVPHHHHVYGHVHDMAQSCDHEQDHEQDHQADHHDCCHAFNDMEFEKGLMPILPIPVPASMELQILERKDLRAENMTGLAIVSFPWLIPLEEGAKQGLRLLRAPPIWM